MYSSPYYVNYQISKDVKRSHKYYNLPQIFITKHINAFNYMFKEAIINFH